MSLLTTLKAACPPDTDRFYLRNVICRLGIRYHTVGRGCALVPSTGEIISLPSASETEQCVGWRMVFSFPRQIGQLWETPPSLCLKIQP